MLRARTRDGQTLDVPVIGDATLADDAATNSKFGSGRSSGSFRPGGSLNWGHAPTLDREQRANALKEIRSVRDLERRAG